MIFEGEFLKGQKWNGKGKEYLYYKKLQFDGQIENTIKLKIYKVFEVEYIKGCKIKGKELDF